MKITTRNLNFNENTIQTLFHPVQFFKKVERENIDIALIVYLVIIKIIAPLISILIFLKYSNDSNELSSQIHTIIEQINNNGIIHNKKAIIFLLIIVIVYLMLYWVLYFIFLFIANKVVQKILKLFNKNVSFYSLFNISVYSQLLCDLINIFILLVFVVIAQSSEFTRHISNIQTIINFSAFLIYIYGINLFLKDQQTIQ
jgi:hypothetical protein